MAACCVSRVSSATDCTCNLVVIAVRCSFTVRSLGAKIGGDLLVKPSFYNVREHFEFPCSKSIEAPAQLFLHGPLLTFVRVTGKGAVYRLDQFFLRRSLFQEIHCAATHRAYRRRNISMAGEEKQRRWISVSASADCKSGPLAPGICKSATTQPGASGSRCPRKSATHEKVFTANSLALNSLEIAARNDASSSTI